MPDIGVSSDELEFNTYIKLTAPKQLNIYKPGKSISLDIENLSDKEWTFNIKDILIYQYENQAWKKVSDKMINIGTTEEILGQKGKFPLDEVLVGVLPEVKPDQSTRLRIIIIFHGQDNGKENQKGAFVDVFLRP